MGDLGKFKISATDWREATRKNARKTINVIIIFILIYLAVGFLIDLYIYAGYHYPIEEASIGLLTFKLWPEATIIMLIVALISLGIAYFFHDKIMMLGTDYHEVTNDSSSSLVEKQLYNVVEELKIASSLRFMPKIYIIEANYMNAFASGFSEKSALVAITRGLLEKLDRRELQAVMAHELSHIRNNDIRLTLTVALLSNLILIAIDLLFRGVIYGRSRERNQLAVIVLLARFLLPILTVLLMLYLSRTREYMADAGSVELLRDNQGLASALLKIDSDHKDHSASYAKAYSNTPNEQIREAAYLYDPHDAGFSAISSINSLFSSHPSLEDRLKALGIEKKL